jgi:hypothetical protein
MESPPSNKSPELEQSWRDQCYRMADFADPVLDQCSTGQVNDVGYEVYILSHHSLPQIIGWLTNHVFSPDRQKLQVTMTNCDTSIDVTCLRLGNASKADQPLSARTFGEGLKGTINDCTNMLACILRLNCFINFRAHMSFNRPCHID